MINNTHENIAVIAFNHLDFVQYVHGLINSKDIKENIIEDSTHRITTDTKKYICIVDKYDMHSYSFNNLIKTPKSIDNKNYQAIMINIFPNLMSDIDPEFVKIVDEYFWELLA